MSALRTTKRQKSRVGQESWLYLPILFIHFNYYFISYIILPSNLTCDRSKLKRFDAVELYLSMK